MQPWFVGSQFDGRLIFGYGVHVALRSSVGLRQELADAPRFWVGFEHPGVTVVGDKKMCAAAMIKNIDVIRSKFCGLVEGLNGFVSISFFERDDSQPHPRGRIFWTDGGFLL